MIFRMGLIAMAAGVAMSFGATVGPEPVLAFGTNPAPGPCAKYKRGTKRWKRCRRRNGLPTAALEQTEQALTLGYALAKAGRYRQALDVLRPVEAANDPRVLTYIGFSERKLGRVERAIAYYRRALALDSRNVATLSYMGEAHLQTGDVGAARAKLARIASLCGTSCDAYKALDTAIVEHTQAG